MKKLSEPYVFTSAFSCEISIIFICLFFIVVTVFSIRGRIHFCNGCIGQVYYSCLFCFGRFLLTVNRENNGAEKIYITPRCFLFVILCGHFLFSFRHSHGGTGFLSAHRPRFIVLASLWYVGRV